MEYTGQVLVTEKIRTQKAKDNFMKKFQYDITNSTKNHMNILNSVWLFPDGTNTAAWDIVHMSKK